jgi:SAM-dependent methyltransferase
MVAGASVPRRPRGVPAPALGSPSGSPRAPLKDGPGTPIEQSCPRYRRTSQCGEASTNWSARGDEWSEAWGGVPYQWWGTLFPRLQGYLPARRILEIAPGYGRWTHFLRDLCHELIIVDIAAQAIEHCRQRFAADEHVRAFVNDGTSLPMAADRSIDLVFSFDSLVHAEADVIAGYLRELARVLAADGVAFIHHSNMAAYPAGTFDPNNIHWRATSVSAAVVESLAQTVGLGCVSQETLAWGNEALLNDCISVLTRSGSSWARENVVRENIDFSRLEIAMVSRFSEQYPPFGRDLRIDLSHDAPRTDEHRRALQMLEQGCDEDARRVLHEHLRRVLDPEALNDLAVLTMRCGDSETAVRLLEALVCLHPDDEPAARNLAALALRPSP